jgi:hypothetical protein
MTAYQPIKTAPRDREIYVATIIDDHVSEQRAKWSTSCQHPDIMFPVHIAGWNVGNNERIRTPTHWRD